MRIKPVTVSTSYNGEIEGLTNKGNMKMVEEGKNREYFETEIPVDFFKEEANEYSNATRSLKEVRDVAENEKINRGTEAGYEFDGKTIDATAIKRAEVVEDEAELPLDTYKMDAPKSIKTMIMSGVDKVGDDSIQDKNINTGDFGNDMIQVAKNAGAGLMNSLGFTTSDLSQMINMFDPNYGPTKFDEQISNLSTWKNDYSKDIHIYDWKPGQTIPVDLLKDIENAVDDVGGAFAEGFGVDLSQTKYGKARTRWKNNKWVHPDPLETVRTGILAAKGEVAYKTLKIKGPQEVEPSTVNEYSKDEDPTNSVGSEAEAKSGIVRLTYNDKDTINNGGDINLIRHYEGQDDKIGNISDDLTKEEGENSKKDYFLKKVVTEENSDGNISELDNLDIIRQKYAGNKNTTFKTKTNSTYILDKKTGDWSGDNDEKEFYPYNASESELIAANALRNRNNYLKTIGYIYIRPGYNYQTSNDSIQDLKIGTGTFQIPFEFNPEFAEGSSNANYISEKLLNRIGQFYVYTGTDTSQITIKTDYLALAPNNLDKVEAEEAMKNYSTDAWEYYWTPLKLQEIEYKYRSLVFPDMTSGEGIVIKPPLIEIHMVNQNGFISSVGDLFEYPRVLSSDYLSITRQIGNFNSYKKYVVTSVQIDPIKEDGYQYPSLFGRNWSFKDANSSGNPINHLKYHDESSKMGYSGLTTKLGFKVTLQATEVTENFLDLVPDFRAYYDSWTSMDSLSDGAYKADVVPALSTAINYNLDDLKADVRQGLLDSRTIREKIEEAYKKAAVIASLYDVAYKTIRLDDTDKEKLRSFLIERS